jgi:hypothetical protein
MARAWREHGAPIRYRDYTRGGAALERLQNFVVLCIAGIGYVVG